jgi:small subunit ribosomal protein S9
MAAPKQVFYATGRRKTSAARVFMKPGSGKMEINGKEGDGYLTTANGRMSIQVPLAVTDTKGKFDIRITVTGGGPNGQAEAIRHGIARALVASDEQLRPVLKKAGLLTRDDRMVERKKYGKHKARKSCQFSKR